MGLKSIRERSIRSWLTIFGIVISIAVILTLLSLSAGVSGAINELFDEFGRNRIFVMAEFNNPTQITQQLLESDVGYIESLPYFKMVVPTIVRQAQKVEYGGTELYLMVQSFPSSNADAINKEYRIEENLVEGRSFNEDERGVAILGYSIAYDDDFFEKPIKLRNSVYVNDHKFTVVGIYKELGVEDDRSVIITYEDAKTVLNSSETVTAIDAVVKDGIDIDFAEERLIRALERKKGKDTFITMTPESLIKQFNNIMALAQGILLAIASVSLIVGAVGIANNMFTSVLEREKEIGIMKSIGATNSDILQIFMLESGLIGFFGGLAGIILGIIFSLVIGFVAIEMGYPMLKVYILPLNVFGVLAFAFFVGLISGLIPAWSASKKKIIDTLREH
ncbi:MAG: ABC transporter permease [Candidatus Aenigmarchaeota archaeon]|nr:ABC transporter permease [Candidatus Aenigmarchaeota archaeon]